jgi:D-glycero-alpha-D-manno-heptose-7-phosphate kinase
MIISRTPFRISFFGGGTDYPVWYEENEGRVLNATINKYCFVTLRELPPFFKYKYRARYYEREETSSLEEIRHPSIRECLKYLEIEQGVEVVHHADLPARSGLGSSSTFTICMLHAGYALKYQMPTKLQLALDAIHVEQKEIGESVGSQDQTAAAFGGLNRIEFGGSRLVNVTPLILAPDRLDDFQNHLMLFFTGFSRTASEVAELQIRLTPSKTKELNSMLELCREAEKHLVTPSCPLKDFGLLLNEQWNLKKSMSPQISNDQIDAIYNKGLAAGALGGKLLGAGGGGFMLFFVEPEKRHYLQQTLENLLHVPFRIEFGGSQIIYYGHHA